MLQEFRDSWRQQNQVIEAAKHVEVLRRELLEMAASIEQARREVAALRPPNGASDKILSATNELDAIVISTERASIEILNAAERLMDLSGKLKADGANPILCTEIESEVMNIFTACSFQDLTGQRTSKVVNALRYIEQRINAMISIWGDEALASISGLPEEPADSRPDAHLLNGPQLHGHGVSQADVDSMFDAPAPAAPAPAPAPAQAPAAPVVASQSDIDNMFDAPAPAAPAVASQSDIDSMFDAPAAAPAVASQSDIDSMFDTPAPAPKPAPPPKPAPKPAAAAPKPAAKPAPKPAPAVEEDPPPPLDQAAIDALFG
nr:protein phosphatase CheZ [Azospirillum sp. SYSU D00513]